MKKLTSIEKQQRMKGNKKVVNRVVRGWLAKNKVGIVHGSRATNVQLPKNLKRETIDWDVFVKNPRKRAMQLEKVLDKKFGGDFFHVKRGANVDLKVNKIISNVDYEGVVDFAISNREVPSIAKRGVRFATLKDQVARARETIKNPEAKFRIEKDLSLIRRVRKFEKRRGKKI
jgi:hypothetical protein